MDRNHSEIAYKSPAVIAGLVPLLFLIVFYFFPLSGIFFKSFFPDNTPDLSAVADFFTSNRMIGIVWFTCWQAALSTALTVVFALPCAYVTARYRFFGKKALMSVATIPFVLPTVVVAAAFRALAGKNGFFTFIDIDSSIYIILFAHLFYNFSVVLRILSSHLSYINTEINEAACMLGASPFTAFFRITLPLLKPAVFAASLLVFVFCFSSFGVILILGGPQYTTIEVEIYRQAAHIFNLPAASLLSLIQIAVTFLLVWWYAVFQKKAAKFLPESEQGQAKPPETPREKLAVAAAVLFILLLCCAPLLALVLKSLIYKGAFSLVFYKALLTNITGSIFYISPLKAAFNSLVFSGITLFLALIIGLSAALSINYTGGKLSRLIDPLFMLPISTSAVTLGFGIILTLDAPPLNLRTSPFIVPCSHTLVAFPFVVRAVLPALRTIPDSLKASASVLGASPLKILSRIELPIIARALTAGALFAFCISMGEFGATIFTARPEFSTLPLAIYRFFSQPGTINYGQGMAVSTLLMLVTAAGLFLIENLRSISTEGF